MKQYWRRIRWYWRCVVIIIPIIAVCFVISFFKSNAVCKFIIGMVNDWASALSVAAAGIIAIVAFLAIRNTNLQAALQRKQDLDKETRDRKERYLNALLEWLTDIEGRIFPRDISVVEEVKQGLADRAFDKSLGWKDADKLENLRDLDKSLSRIGLLQAEIRDCKYFKDVALGIDSNLSEQIDNILNSMNERIDMTLKYRKEALDKEKIDKEELLKLSLSDVANSERLNLSKKGLAITQMGANAHTIKEQISSAISKAIELKTGLLKV